MHGLVLSLTALALLAGLVLVACGGGSSRPSTSQAVPEPSAPPAEAAQRAPARASGADVDAVALVAGKPIAKSSYEHWLSIERDLGAGGNAGHRALGFLIGSDWLVAEASARRVSASQADIQQRLGQLERQSFSKSGSLQAFLAKSSESEADLLVRVRNELLESRITAEVAAGMSATASKRVLASFQQGYQQRWRSRTTCKPAYVMEDCSEYKGAPEAPAVPISVPSSQSSPRGSRQAPVSKSTRKSKFVSRSIPTAVSAPTSSAQVKALENTEIGAAPPGALSLTSPAFARNGVIPEQYTCAGADISPPLEWQHLPAHTAALVLFVIDDTPTGPASGIRWVVGDISPSAKGVAAGGTPEDGVVGSDTQGQSHYGGICPAHGKTSLIEFQLYALNKKIPLSPGFQAALAEGEYGGHLLGSAAVTYGIAYGP
jgi:phosphatidylethanolamine-binding protein (PEBP) family uncharacterized protein